MTKRLPIKTGRAIHARIDFFILVHPWRCDRLPDALSFQGRFRRSRKRIPEAASFYDSRQVCGTRQNACVQIERS